MIRRAQELGAKLHRNGLGRWVCLDMPATPLWRLSFDTPERAARAFLIVTKQA